EHHRATDRADLAVAGVRDPVRGGALLPGAGHPAARPELGRDAVRRAGVRLPGVVDERVPRAGDLRDRAGLQPARRRAAGRARPEAAHPDRGEAAMSVFEVEDLHVSIGRTPIVQGVSFSLEAEQTLGIVGESGSGKSMTVLAATGLLDAPGARVSGSAVVHE